MEQYVRNACELRDQRSGRRRAALSASLCRRVGRRPRRAHGAYAGALAPDPAAGPALAPRFETLVSRRPGPQACRRHRLGRHDLTRHPAPGKYTVTWDGKDDHGKPLGPGTYTVCIEAAREHGTYQIIRTDVTVADKPFVEELKGNVEIKSASIEYRRKGAALSARAGKTAMHARPLALRPVVSKFRSPEVQSGEDR